MVSIICCAVPLRGAGRPVVSPLSPKATLLTRVEIGRLAASLGTEPPQGDGFLGQGFWEQIARMPAIPKADGAAQGGRSIASNPHRGMRFLDGFWKKAKIDNLVVLALEGWLVRSA